MKLVKLKQLLKQPFLRIQLSLPLCKSVRKLLKIPFEYHYSTMKILRTNRFFGVFFGFTALLILCLNACTEPTTIGTELLEGDLQDLNLISDFKIETRTLQGDSVRTFSPLLSAQLTTYPFGQYTDPIFGKVKSSIYAQVSLNGAGPDFSDKTLDSVVFVLPYVVDYGYGEIQNTMSLDVLQIAEEVDVSEVLFSDTVFATDMMPLGQSTFTVSNGEFDSLSVEVPRNDTLGTDAELVAPQLRISMDPVFAEALFNADSEVFASDSAFTANYNGFHFTPTSDNQGLTGFNIRNNADAGLFVYYHTDTTTLFYRFPFASSDLKMTKYEHDYTGFVTEELLNSPNNEDSLFVVQGLAGVSGEIGFPDLSALDGNFAINKAELVLRVASLQEDSDIYVVPEQLISSRLDNNGDYVVTEDASRATFANQTTLTTELLPSLYGGEFTEGENGEPGTYTINMTAYLQNVLRGDAVEKIRLAVYRKELRANRAVFYGGSHSQYPPVLNVYYTEF